MGSGRGSPPPIPRALTARAAARRVRSCPSPRAPRASLHLGRHRRPCPPPPLPRLCLGGGGAPTPGRPGEGRGGDGGLPPCGRAAPEARQSRTRRHPSAPPSSSHPPSPALVAAPTSLVLRGTGRGTGRQHSGHKSLHSLRVACSPRRRVWAPPSALGGGGWRFLVPAQTGPAAWCWAAPRACRSGRGELCWGRCVATRGGEVMARRRCAAPLVPAAGLLWGRALHLRSQPWPGGVPGRGLSRRPARGALPGLPGGGGRGGWGRGVEEQGGGD